MQEDEPLSMPWALQFCSTRLDRLTKRTLVRLAKEFDVSVDQAWDKQDLANVCAEQLLMETDSEDEDE